MTEKSQAFDPGATRVIIYLEVTDREVPILVSLARSLGDGVTSAFRQRYQKVANSGDKQSRMALLDVLSEIPSDELHRNVLAVALTDSDFDLRDAASEALFSLTESNCGYDPGDPTEGRVQVVERILDTHFQPVPGTGQAATGWKSRSIVLP